MPFKVAFPFKETGHTWKSSHDFVQGRQLLSHVCFTADRSLLKMASLYMEEFASKRMITFQKLGKTVLTELFPLKVIRLSYNSTKHAWKSFHHFVQK